MIIEGQKRKKPIILIAIVISVILYLAGVFSGLYANSLFKEATERDIFELKEETLQDLEVLQNYVDVLDSNLKGMQLEQAFGETLTEEKICVFTSISLNELFNQLGYYWERLPFRLEEYERYNEPSEEYNMLKQQYAYLSIRTWIIARNQYEKCNRDIIHGLYFYSADCVECIEQGKELDKFNKEMRDSGKDLVMFPIDFYLNETIVTNLKKFYNISSTPALIINDKVFQGRLFKFKELVPK